jgi:pimeloyl-ACP methyl ester carboxylesterase
MSEATSNAPLTVALVHGAFADSSSWDAVIEILQAGGIQVTAAPNPLRGISQDSAYVASFMRQVPGPVLAVGHSYGGAVISNAATELGNVVGLVFVAAFAPDEGERLGEVTAGSRDSVLGTAQVALQYPTADGVRTTEFAIDPAKLRGVRRRPADATGRRNGGDPAASLQLAFTSRRDRPPGSHCRRGRSSRQPTRQPARMIQSMAERASATITEVEART